MAKKDDSRKEKFVSSVFTVLLYSSSTENGNFKSVIFKWKNIRACVELQAESFGTFSDRIEQVLTELCQNLYF